MARINSRLSKLNGELRPKGYVPMAIIYEEEDGTATLNDVVYPTVKAVVATLPTGAAWLIIRFVGEGDASCGKDLISVWPGWRATSLPSDPAS